MTTATQANPGEVKETVRRFKVTTNLVLNLENHKNASDEQINNTIEKLLDFAFSKADSSILLEADTTNIEEVTL